MNSFPSDLHSYKELIEAYKQVNSPEVDGVEEEILSEEENLEEVWGDAFAGAREDNARDAARRAKIKPAAPNRGGAGALGSTGDALGARMTDGNKSGSSRTAPEGAFGISDKGRAQAKSQQSSVPAGSFGISNTGRQQAAKNRAAAQSQQTSSRPNAGAGDKVPGPKTVKIAPRPASAKPQTGDKKADMAAWAKANPALAAKKAQRDSTRGTSATTNPLMKDMKSRMPAPKPVKPAAKPTATPNPAKPTAGAQAAMKASPLKLNNSTDLSAFDVILEHLVEQGFPVDEALKLMVNMSEEKREKILSTLSEEEADRLRDRRMERGGVGGNQRYDRAPKPANTKKFGSGKTMAQKAMEKKYGKGKSAMDIVRAEIEAKHGKGAIMDTTKKEKKKINKENSEQGRMTVPRRHLSRYVVLGTRKDGSAIMMHS